MAQTIVASSAFSLLLAGTNAINPLLPVYREHLGFDPVLVSLTFVSYVTVLTIVLLCFSRPSLVRWSAWTLCAAMLIAAGSDIFLAMGTESGVLVGRAIAGIAGGAGTGAASALVVAAAGAAGRSVTATGNLVGAVVGTAFAQILVSLFDDGAISTVFVVHGIVCVAMFAALVVVLLVNRASNREALQPVVSRQSLSLSALRGKGSALLVGCVSWVAVSSSIVFLPSFFDDRDLGVVRAVGTIVLLSSSALAQIFSPKLTRVFPGLSGAGLLAAGIALELVGSLTGSTALAIVGFALAGAGLGVAYRLGLLKLTRGASPAQQGALSSLYAAITYAVAAAAVLGAGALGSTIGLESTTYIVFTITAVAALVLWPGAPRLRDVVEPSA